MPALDDLITGYQQFYDNYFQKNKELMLDLAEKGQFPKIALVCCCDSRVDPSIILNCKPGDLFVIRNVANLVPPCESNDSYHGTSAALEFAVTGLKVDHIIVLGHALCGGIKALLKTSPSETPDSFIACWMRQIENVREEILADTTLKTEAQRCRACEQKGIAQSLTNLMTFPWVQERVNRQELDLHGWFYDLHNGRLSALDQHAGDFRIIS